MCVHRMCIWGEREIMESVCMYDIETFEVNMAEADQSAVTCTRRLHSIEIRWFSYLFVYLISEARQ